MIKFASLFGLAQANLNFDKGQYHTHDPNPNTKDYKTGGPITVHIVPHSHDDVGWKKTVNAYFDGSGKNVQWTNVNIELTTVMHALLENPERKFSEVEIKFFKMWWDKQNDKMKQDVKGLIANGQLEILNGGWSMHDEACPTW